MRINTIIFTFLIIITASTAMAEVFVDGSFNMVWTGDVAKNNAGIGGGTGAGIYFNKEWAVLLKASLTTVRRDGGNAEYIHQMYMGGVQYIYNAWKRLHITGSFLMGMSITEVYEKYIRSDIDMGVNMTLLGGIFYDVRQYLAPMIEVGYHRSFYTKDFKDKNVGGVVILIGVRVTPGHRKSITRPYE